MARFVVTGGGGFLGGHIARALLKEGHQVRIFSRKSYPALAAEGIPSLTGNIESKDDLTQALKATDCVVHSAAKAPFWGSYESYFRPNVLGTQNVIDACLEGGVPRLVYTSSPSVTYAEGSVEGGDESLPYPRRYFNPYPATKAEAERRVLAAHRPGVLHTAAIRPHLLFGPDDPHFLPRLFEKAKKKRLARVGSGQNRVSVCCVENAAFAHLLAAKALEQPDHPAGGKTYFINEPEPVNLFDFLDRLLVGVGLPRIERRISHRAAHLFGLVMEGVYQLFPLGEPPLTRFLAANLACSHWFKIDRARRDLGYAPILGLEEGILRVIEAFGRPHTPTSD